MSTLPGRPSLDQLRRQARELHRAATDGDEDSVRRVRAVSARFTLSAAQLAIAREYGFASWPKLRTEVARRRAAADDPGPDPPAVADGEQLIDAQYADRPQLRPILDAVLAALPALGPVTVQARGTYVSLVTPRRTFAVVQATTKSRVDLGLRLAGARPEGRLREAKNVGQATVRIPLSTLGDVDEEVLAWLRRAYEENTAPPPPPRPARRQAPVLGPMTVVIEGSELPGLSCQPDGDGTEHRNVHVALYTRSRDQPTLAMPGNPWQAAEPLPADSPAVRWEVAVVVRQDDDGYDFSGPFVRGVRADRHLGLAWGDVPGDGTLRLFRGAKLRLVEVPPSLIAEAIRPGHRLVARVRLTDAKGYPVCARLRPQYLTWSAEPSAPVP
jgi:hypothetical protein